MQREQGGFVLRGAVTMAKCQRRAAQRARLHEVPVVVRDYSDSETLQIALLENIQRQDLNAIEEAGGYRELIERFGYTQDALAEVIGKSRMEATRSEYSS